MPPVPAAESIVGGDDAGFGLPVRPSAPGRGALESTLAGHFDGWFPGMRFNLANGQIWQIDDDSTGAYVGRRDPKVRITPGLLGSFFLEVDGISQTPRVKRLK